jgi:hypothetical protein
MSIHVNLRHIIQFMSNHIIHVNCQLMSIHVNSRHLSYRFSENSVKSGGGEGMVKYVFLGLRRQLRCQAEGKNWRGVPDPLVSHSPS